MTDYESRITHLEERVAHQSRTIEELSDQLVEHWKIAEQARVKLDRLVERFLELEERSREAVAVAPPPHY